MSKLIMITAITGLFLLGCQKKEIRSTEDKLTSGTWSVSSFVETQTDKTNSYDNDVYLFNKDGSISISGQHTGTGFWNVNGVTNTSNEHIEVRLQIDGQCSRLSRSWYILEESDNMIQLAEELQDNEFNYLTFTKN